ncbi:MAG TPA: TonB-dependent receptor [Candidatus Acidoferrum sp.]|nr:TonB-dependent receptor [Candidatus Acidoferrum sp.]
MKHFCLVIQTLLVVFFFGIAPSVFAQAGNSGTINGTVTDPSGAVVADATVTIHNPVSQYDRSTTTDSSGNFSFTNVPFNPYLLSVTAKGFASYAENVELRSNVPLALPKIKLQLAGASSTVTVQAGGELVENEPTTHVDVDRDLFNKVPLESASSSISSLVTLASPGVAADSNGLFHGFGDHASNSFSVDGQPITDQQSKVFSNQIPVDSVQSLEVIEGAPPAEYGGKTSLVIVATTRSGLGETTPHGDVTASYGTFGSSNGGFDLGFGSKSLGNFISANGLNTSRFLDGPEVAVFHDRGNEENLFDRIDYKPSDANTLSLNFQYSRSWFQTPNSWDAEDASEWSFNAITPTCPPGQIGSCGGLGPNGLPVGPADQRSKIGTYNIAPSWSYLINQDTVFSLGAWTRHDQYNYYPSADPFADASPDLQTSTVGQNRSLTDAGLRATVSYTKGINNIKAGAIWESEFLNENDQYGIVDPGVNPVCLNADGSPDTNPAITDPAACTGTLTPNPAFVPLLGCYDLTRTAPLPVSDGCPTGQTASTLYDYYGHADIKEPAFYGEDIITKGQWNFNLGARVDLYRGISRAQQLEPRVGIAYNIKATGTVLRVSYARTMETPFNENLVIASTGCSNPVIFDFQLDVAGASCSSPNSPPLSPGKRNEFHVGFGQSFGRHLVVDAEYIQKYTTRAFDFSVLDNTPITYPIEWSRSRIPGFALRAAVPDYHGFTAYVVMSSVGAIFYNPQVSGIGATPQAPAGAAFRIDHDERYNQTTHLQYQPFKKFPWISLNWRYDSGLVAGALPYAGCQGYDPVSMGCPDGTVTNGPMGINGQGSADVVDTSGITADQQFEAGLYCGSVRATPFTPISSSLGANLCPVASYGSNLVSIPAPDTEQDNSNPPRIAPRNLFDLAIGDDNLFNQEHHQWSLRLTVINITNKTALYNFLSTFSGTHYVTPRAITAQVGFHF